MRKFLYSFICSILVVIAWAPVSQAGTRLGFVGALQSSVPVITSNTLSTFSPATNTSYGGGVLLYLGAFPAFELETGALYIQRKSGTAINPGAGLYSQTYTFSDIQIPLQLRFSLLPILSLGAGIVYNIGVGNVSVDQTDPLNIRGGNFTGNSQTYSQIQNASTDLAYVLSLEGRVPLPGKWGVFANVNYQIGATNMDTSPSTTTKLNVLQVLAGLSRDLF